MRKKVGIVKRIFTLLLIFLLSINSFAAIVSDNDGSAFITKAELDALKSSFQAQIDSYNMSIDSKIDGAIASYLSGISIRTRETQQNFFKDFLNLNCEVYSNVYWNSTDNRQLGKNQVFETQKNITSICFNREDASAAGNLYGMNMYLCGVYTNAGTQQEMTEKYTDGFNGWATARYMLSGVLFGATINGGRVVSSSRTFTGFFTKYNKRFMGTQYWYGHNGTSGTAGDTSSVGSNYGNGLVASIDKQYYVGGTWVASVDKYNYWFAPWSHTEFAYEDMTSTTYTWDSGSNQIWSFTGKAKDYISGWSYDYQTTYNNF